MAQEPTSGDLEIVLREPRLHPRPELFLDQAGHARRQRHREAVVADRPGHGVERIGDEPGTVGGEPPRRSIAGGSDHGRRGAVGKQAVGHDRVRLGRVLEVQRAQLHRAHEHSRIGGSHQRSATRSALSAPWQPMKPTCTRWICRSQSQPRDQRDVHAWRHEARARHRDEVRDRIGGHASRRQRTSRGLLGQRGRSCRVVGHALGRRRSLSAGGLRQRPQRLQIGHRLPAAWL